MRTRLLLFLFLQVMCCSAAFSQNAVEEELLAKLGGRWWKEVRVCDVLRNNCKEDETYYDFASKGYVSKDFESDTSRFYFPFHLAFYREDIITDDTILFISACNPMLTTYGRLDDGSYVMRYLGEAGIWFMVLRFTGPKSLMWEGVLPNGDNRLERIYWEVVDKPLPRCK